MWGFLLYFLLIKLTWFFLPLRRIKQHFDRKRLGPEIEKRAADYEDPKGYKVYAWALYKERHFLIYYHPDDFTPEELRALDVMRDMDYRRGPKSTLLDRICGLKREDGPKK